MLRVSPDRSSPDLPTLRLCLAIRSVSACGGTITAPGLLGLGLVIPSFHVGYVPCDDCWCEKVCSLSFVKEGHTTFVSALYPSLLGSGDYR